MKDQERLFLAIIKYLSKSMIANEITTHKDRRTKIRTIKRINVGLSTMSKTHTVYQAIESHQFDPV